MRRKVYQIRWETPDGRGFRNYAEEYYVSMIIMAENILRLASYNPDQEQLMLAAVFEKISSPLVYLYDQWETLPPEERKKYMPKEDVEKIDETIKKLLEELEK